LAEHFNRMAEAVSLHMEELQEMIRRRDQFVADFTHEIKTPMTTIIGYADVMRSMELPREEEIMSLNYIFSEGKRLETMAGKLFELIYYREHPIETKPIHTVDLGREVERIARPAMEKKQQTLVVEMEPAILSGAQELLVTVLINLLDNARKASEPGQSVYLTGAVVRQEESGTPTGYHILVEDHGIGMAPEEVQKICDEFYMVDKSRARKEGGAGLGMSLVSLIVKRHGATLTIDSCPGKGTRMQITFPSAQMEEV
jgi:signal transduction histidine kinase